MTAEPIVRNPWTQPTQPATAWEDEPIKREFCLDVLDEYAGEVFPARCCRNYGHDGNHMARAQHGPAVEWAADVLDEAETGPGGANVVEMGPSATETVSEPVRGYSHEGEVWSA